MTFVERCLQLANQEKKPTVPEVRPLVQEFYFMPGNGAGGGLHIVLDDHNTEDSSVDYCIAAAIFEDYHDPECLALALLLRRMSRTQREKLAGSVYI